VLVLSRDELCELTRYKQADKQAEVLTEQGIPYKEVRGRLVVLRDHVTAWMENRPVRQIVKPRLDLVR
jgi:hypothetical protein